MPLGNMETLHPALELDRDPHPNISIHFLSSHTAKTESPTLYDLVASVL